MTNLAVFFENGHLVIEILFIIITLTFLEVGYSSKLVLSRLNNIKTEKIPKKDSLWLNITLTTFLYCLKDILLEKLSWKLYLLIVVILGGWRKEILTVLIFKPWVILRKIPSGSKVADVFESVSKEGLDTKTTKKHQAKLSETPTKEKDPNHENDPSNQETQKKEE